MQRVIVKSNNADHNGQSYIVQVKKTGTVMTDNTGHIQKMPIMIEQYPGKQIAKSTGYLTDLLTNVDLIRQYRTFNPYMECTQIRTN